MNTSEGAKLKAVVREALKELEARLLTQRFTYTFAEAGRLLGRSTRTISRMVFKGELHPVTVNGARMISAAELVRISTPRGENRRQARAGRTRSGDHRQAAAGIDAMLRRRR